MTTTPAPTDIDLIRKHIQLAEDWAEYGHVGDPNWHVARTLIKQVPALLDELATYKAEVKHADAEREEAERNRDAAREELAKTRAELDAMKVALGKASESPTPGHPRSWACHEGRCHTCDRDWCRHACHVEANPATTAEPADEPKATKPDWSEFGDCGCGAKRGEPCTYTYGTRTGRPRTWPHPERFGEFHAEPAAG